jgi:hypothetical protein
MKIFTLIISIFIAAFCSSYSGLNTCSGMTSDSCIKSNYPLPGTVKTLSKNMPDGALFGYVSGTNLSHDKIKANYFSFNNQYPYITGAYFKFGVANSIHYPVITFGIWNQLNNKPYKMISSATLPFSTIIDDIANNRETYVKFDSTVKVTGAYYIGVFLPTTYKDTLALQSNTNGDTKPGTAWELWVNDAWHAYSEPDCWYINIANAIFPDICESYSGANSVIINNEAAEVNVFPNPAGEKVNISFGNTLVKNIKFNIYNLLGSCIKSYSFSKPANEFHIDLKDLPKGVYFLSIIFDKQKLTKKLTVIR